MDGVRPHLDMDPTHHRQPANINPPSQPGQFRLESLVRRISLVKGSHLVFQPEEQAADVISFIKPIGVNKA